MIHLRHPILLAGAALTLFAIIGTTLVAVTHHTTAERIAANERQALLRHLHQIAPYTLIDNDLTQETRTLFNAEIFGQPETLVYLGRRKGEPVVAIYTPVVPDGYAGPIRLLVAVLYDGTLSGVRVLSHKETPGLGDKMELEKSNWILSFNGRSLDNPPEALWRVQRDGGLFDQFTGATITPRAIVKAVKKTLLYHRHHAADLFPPLSEEVTPASPPAAATVSPAAAATPEPNVALSPETQEPQESQASQHALDAESAAEERIPPGDLATETPSTQESQESQESDNDDDPQL